MEVIRAMPVPAVVLQRPQHGMALRDGVLQECVLGCLSLATTCRRRRRRLLRHRVEAVRSLEALVEQPQRLDSLLVRTVQATGLRFWRRFPVKSPHRKCYPCQHSE
jgi:hypothetical protein